MTKGNARSSGYELAEYEWYVEPVRAVEALLRVETFAGSIHDPACGGGTIPRCASVAGYHATGADIVDRGYGPVRDFLSDTGQYANVVTNPPFKIAVPFALHALARTSGKVAILQRLSWLEGAARHKALFAPGYLRRVWAFSSRISMPPGGTDIPATGGAVAYAWFVFEPTPAPGQVALGWVG
jgi:hypothetical protein